MRRAIRRLVLRPKDYESCAPMQPARHTSPGPRRRQSAAGGCEAKQTGPAGAEGASAESDDAAEANRVRPDPCVRAPLRPWTAREVDAL